MEASGFLTRRGHELLFAVTAGGLAAGAAAHRLWSPGAGDALWSLVTLFALAPAVWWVGKDLVRRRFGSDVIAVLALAGTLAVDEPFAGSVIAVMLTGGQMLEERAARRARRDLGMLLSLAPRVAHRREGDGFETVDVGEVRPGDRLLVRSGETVPVDGQVEDGTAVLDESTLTGEPLPVERPAGDAVRAGTVNSGAPFELRATSDARTSTYAGIVRLAEEAAAESAPFVRLADRYAALFLPLTLVLAGAAWVAAGNAVRAVAVLVVATPCPLILAAPIAFVSGLSRSARRGVVVKGGSALERLAEARVLLFDKTGTVTMGRPSLDEIVAAPDAPPGDPLLLAASLDQVSSHVLASSIVRAARERGLRLLTPADVTESAGEGVRGTVGGRRVAVGKAAFAGEADEEWLRRVRGRAAARGAITVFVGVDGRIAGALLMRDRIRPDAARTMRLLRRSGIGRAVMITGDRADFAEPIAELVGADVVHADQTPAGKVAVVRDESARAPAVMVGDGVNDAPALAAAGVGVALGARGATVSSEAADVVITVDRLERLAETLAIARRTRSVARQSVLMGMGLSLTAMVAAAFGLLTPAAGALLQEGIDVAAILSALRVLGPGTDRRPRLRGDEAELVRRLDEEHRVLWPRIERLPELAAVISRDAARDGARDGGGDGGGDRAGDGGGPEREAAMGALSEFLTDLAEHERKDERLLYPAVARALGGTDPTGAMSRGHTEIARLTRRVRALLAELRADPAAPEPARDLRRTVQELYAVLRLHFAQEEENYFVLADDPAPRD